MNALSGGIQLETANSIDSDISYIPILIGGFIVLAVIFLAIGGTYAEKIDKNSSAISKLDKATMIGSYIISIVSILAIIISIIIVAVSMNAYYDDSAAKSNANITKVKDSYGITLNNDNVNGYGNKDAVGGARMGAYHISRENLTNGTVDNYKITIDEHKVLRVFQPKDQNTKTWVEVKPQQ
jgi:F0F1-type ATP synthase membrane subunit c/vacuolar-type H+-ATPase subunit K